MDAALPGILEDVTATALIAAIGNGTAFRIEAIFMGFRGPEALLNLHGRRQTGSNRSVKRSAFGQTRSAEGLYFTLMPTVCPPSTHHRMPSREGAIRRAKPQDRGRDLFRLAQASMKIPDISQALHPVPAATAAQYIALHLA